MIDRIRSGIPGVTFRTTMLVGHPGETEEDFQELKRFCRDMEFDRLGVFAYSDEENTMAHGLSAKVAARTAGRRQRELMTQQVQIAAARNRRLAGKEFPVLIEGLSQESELLIQGRLESAGARNRRRLPDQRFRSRSCERRRVPGHSDHQGARTRPSRYRRALESDAGEARGTGLRSSGERDGQDGEVPTMRPGH